MLYVFYHNKNALQKKIHYIERGHLFFQTIVASGIISEIPLSYYHLVASFYKVLRESVPKQVDKKSAVPKEEQGDCSFWRGDRGPEFSKRRKGKTFFFSFLSL